MWRDCKVRSVILLVKLNPAILPNIPRIFGYNVEFCDMQHYWLCRFVALIFRQKILRSKNKMQTVAFFGCKVWSKYVYKWNELTSRWKCTHLCVLPFSINLFRMNFGYSERKTFDYFPTWIGFWRLIVLNFDTNNIHNSNLKGDQVRRNL